MARFCGKCGSPLEEKSAFCPKCGQPSVAPTQNTSPSQTQGYDAEKLKAERAVQLAEQKAKRKEEKKRAWAAAKKRYKADVAAKKDVIKKAKKEKKKARLSAMSAGQRAVRVLVKLLILLLILALVAGGVYMGLKKLGLFSDKDEGGVNETTSAESTTETSEDTEEAESAGSMDVFDPPADTMPEDYEVTPPDADEYYAENGEIVTEIDADNAGRTEAQAHKNLTDRGFTASPVTTYYSADGTYTDETVISESGSEKHPIYTTYYTTEEGFVWIIYEINGDVFASPVSYNMEYSYKTPVMISETETVTSYDNNTGKFYVTKPAETVLDVRVIDKIDAETLDTLTVKEIKDL